MYNTQLMVSSNCINSQIEKKKYSRNGASTTVAWVLFVGATAMRIADKENINANYNFSTPPYIQYVNLGYEVGAKNLPIINLLKQENINKIQKMAEFEEDWNGTGGCIFSKTAISMFMEIIETVDKQPQIAPTGRNSILMQYELADKSILAFEVSEQRVEKVLVPQQDYSLADIEVFTENLSQKINECVRSFYGFKQN